MLRVNLSSGETLTLDLFDDDQAEAARDIIRLRSGEIRGLTLARNGTQHAMPMPRGFRRLRFMVRAVRLPDGTPSFERLDCYADDVLLQLTVYAESPVVRFDTVKTGRLIYSPLENGHAGSRS